MEDEIQMERFDYEKEHFEKLINKQIKLKDKIIEKIASLECQLERVEIETLFLQKSLLDVERREPVTWWSHGRQVEGPNRHRINKQSNQKSVILFLGSLLRQFWDKFFS
jgi:hypothetical protein